MVGGALKRINGVKDPSKSGTPPGQVNKKDSVPQYQPTPIHILKAKSIGSSSTYDPVSNYSASTSRVTLSSCNKRPHTSDAAIATKRSKLIVDNCEIEAKFSDSEDEQTVGRTSIPASSVVGAADRTVSAKCKDATFAKAKSLSTNHRADSSGNSAAKMSTNLPVTASTTKLSATQSLPKSSSNCISSSESQSNVTVSSDHLKSAKMPSAVLNKDIGSGKQHSSNSKAVAGGSEKLHTDKDHISSSGSSGACINENTNHKNNDNVKTLRTEHRHRDHHSSQSSARKHSSKDDHKDDGSGTRTASDQIHSDEHRCSVVAGASKTHRHSSDKHREQSTCNKSEQNHKLDATSKESRKEQLQCETSDDRHRSKINITDNKHTSSHRHSKEHKTYHHKDGKHNQSNGAANSQHRSLKGESCHSKTASASSNKGTKSGHQKPRESASTTGRHHTGHAGRSIAESKTAPSVSSTVAKADTKRVGAVQNIELFGDDSDTESDVLQLSSVSAQSASVKQKDLSLLSRSSVSSRASQSSDDVVLLPTDDLSDSDDVTFEQCHQLFNDLARRQQSRPSATCTNLSVHSVSCLLSLIFHLVTVLNRYGHMLKCTC